MSDSESTLRDYDVDARKEEYRAIGISEEDITLLFTPVARLNKDASLSQRARTARDKMFEATHEAKRLDREEAKALSFEEKMNGVTSKETKK